MKSGKKTLVILAAGKGSRYGGAKQLQEFTSLKKTLLEFSIHDALQVGFNAVLILTRLDLLSHFQKRLAWVKAYADLDFCLQNDSDDNRSKALGTAHALWCCQYKLDSPFLLINADDYYGKTMFESASNHFFKITKDVLAGIIPYTLKDTLSNNGSVSRALCFFNDDTLVSIQELLDIRKNSIAGNKGNSGQYVSMNAWVFHEEIFVYLNAYWEAMKANVVEENTELQLPEFIKWFIVHHKKKVIKLGVGKEWFGITYKEDRAEAELKLSECINKNEYPIFD